MVPFEMKSIILLVFSINTLIHCQPIDVAADQSSKVDHRFMLNLTVSTDNEVNDAIDTSILSSPKNSERFRMPQDVELVDPPSKNQQQQQSVVPGVGSLIDMISAVSSINIKCN